MSLSMVVLGTYTENGDTYDKDFITKEMELLVKEVQTYIANNN